MKSQIRFVIALALLAGTALLLQARNRGEIFPARMSLSSFPQQLGSWTGTDVEIEKEIRDVLGPGDFMLRVYRNAETRLPSNDLFIAYFPSQRAGDTIHSPKNCLPGAGWSPVESSRVSVSLPALEPFPANRYVIAKGEDRQLVLYWYWAHNRAVASEYWAKLYLVTDAMRLNRSDGSMIRITTPLLRGESIDTAQQRLLAFGGNVVPQLNPYIPR